MSPKTSKFQSPKQQTYELSFQNPISKYVYGPLGVAEIL
jgi:hypothetical protein